MEIKALMYALTATGLVSYIAGILLNYSNWKSNILFALGATFMLVRICVYLAKSWQEYRYREWKFKQQIKDEESE